MAARKKPRASARSSSSSKLAIKVGLVAAAAGIVACLAIGLIIVGKLEGQIAPGPGREAVVSNARVTAIVMGIVAGLAVGGAALAVANGVSARLTDLSLAVSKMGRGTKTSVRVQGTDEVAVLARTLSALASDMAGQSSDDEGGGGTATDFDPKVRALRDKVLPNAGFEAPEGYEVDGALSVGSRGGVEYFDGGLSGDSLIMFLVSPVGAGTASVVAARMARDEMLRAIGAGGTARKALAHTNRVLNKNLPKGVGATATVLEIVGQNVKIYQAGARVPVLLCSAGELEDLTADGLALGLDSGPVFEKGLRSNTVEMSAGIRIVVLNDAANRNDDLVASIQEHSPKHTAPFMNMVLGALEQDAGDGGLREDVVLLTVKRA